MNFQYNYNLHGGDRKPLIEAMSQMLGQPAVYQGAPSFAYTVGDYTVNQNGVLACDDSVQAEVAETLIEALRERGFVAETTTNGSESEEPEAVENEPDEKNTEETAITENTPDSHSPNKLTIEVPDTGFTSEVRTNLKKIVASKASLLGQALETDNLSIAELDGKIAFPWFTLHGLDGEADAYSRLITAICNMAKNQKRVTATEKTEENAKYAMRLFLVRLGFIGNEYKTARKILLRNLSGNSSWKSGHKPERSAENTANAESIEPTIISADEEAEESSENKSEGSGEYGK